MEIIQLLPFTKNNMHIIRVLTVFLLSTSAPFCNSNWQTSYLPLIAATCRGAVSPYYTQQQTVITCTTNWYMYTYSYTCEMMKHSTFLIALTL